jgi:hypothetical protein
MVLRIQCLEQEILRDMNWDILLICGVEIVVHIQSQAPTCLLSIREPINFMLRILLACTHGKKIYFSHLRKQFPANMISTFTCPKNKNKF